MSLDDKASSCSMHSVSSSSSRSSVSFSPICVMRRVPCIHTYSYAERSATWFTLDEYTTIRQNYRQIVQQMHQAVPETEDICYRGLEWKQRGTGCLRKFVQKNAVSAVLREQTKQQQNLDHDPEQLRDVYMDFTTEANETAVREAAKDVEAAMMPLISVKNAGNMNKKSKKVKREKARISPISGSTCLTRLVSTAKERGRFKLSNLRRSASLSPLERKKKTS